MNIDPSLKNEHKWYVLQTYAGHEKKVKNQIEQRAKANGLEAEIDEVMIPTQEKIHVSEGKKKKKEEKYLPGYILVKLRLTDDVWRVVRNAEGVKGFVGTDKKPIPLPQSEVDKIISYNKVKQPTYSTSFTVDQSIKVKEGPFKDFVGVISDINVNKSELTVMLSIFGRETPVFLDFSQVDAL